MKRLCSMVSVLLCIILAIPVFLFNFQIVHAKSKPRHVVIVADDGLTQPWYFDDYHKGTSHNLELEDLDLAKNSNMKKWAKPFLEDGNVLGFWMHDLHSEPESIRIWESWDDVTELNPCFTSQKVTSVWSDYYYQLDNYSQVFRPDDIVTIINIGDLQPNNYYGFEPERDNRFLTENSAINYRISDDYLQEIVEDYASSKNTEVKDEYYDEVINSARYSWTKMLELQDILLERDINLISVNVNDGLDKHRGAYDFYMQTLGQQYMKDTQNTGYIEIEYNDIPKFYAEIFPIIQSTSSSDELKGLMFSDMYLYSKSTDYNHELSKLSMNICDSTYSNTTKRCLEKLGAKSFRTYEIEDNFFPDTIKFHLARKTIGDEELIFVVLNGTQGDILLGLLNMTDDEWSHYYEYFLDQNGLKVDTGGVFEPFFFAKLYLMAQLSEYCKGDFSNKKFLITGHSRGAAVGNLLACDLNNDKQVGQKNVYCYTFATPNTYLDGYTAPKANNVFNIVDGGDIVTQLPPGGSKAGKTYGYNSFADVIVSISDLIGRAIYGITQHFPENYIKQLASGEPTKKFDYQKWKWVNIHCETDVVVYDVEGNIVASITNNIVDPNNQYLIITNNDGEKTIILPADEKFTVQVTGKVDNGIMEYSLYTLSSKGLVENIALDTIYFNNSDVFIAQIDNVPFSGRLKDTDVIRSITKTFDEHGKIILFTIIVLTIVLILIILLVIIRKKFK